MIRRTKKKPLSAQIKKHSLTKKKQELEGNTEVMVSTGSTLLDLAISGTRKRGGGIPGGVLMEVFGPESSGKTVLLCEIGGDIQRKGGDIQFNDPEARLNKQFASMFDLNTDDLLIKNPDTVTQVIKGVQEWEPKGSSEINGILTDSLAALSTDLEMENSEGDKMGMRRAKEFSEGFRKIARLLQKENYIMVCSNQIRVKAGATAYGEQFTVPGGKAIAFYSSVRLRFHKPEKIKKKVKVKRKEVTRIIGTKVKVEVYKNSVDAPYRTADIYILFDYGIDDIRANLQFLKDYSSSSVYFVNDTILDKSLDKSVVMIEENSMEDELKEAVIDLWTEIQDKFVQKRNKKKR